MRAPHVGEFAMFVSTGSSNAARDAKTLPLTVKLPAKVNIKPDTLNLKKQGKWLTAYIELPPGYGVENIYIFSVRLEKIPAVCDPKYGYVKDPFGVRWVLFEGSDVVKVIG